MKNTNNQTSNIQYLTSKTKRFIAEFNFPNPDWTSLPDGFPILDKSGLTKQESHLLDGIKLEWSVSEGRHTLYKSAAKRVFIGFAVVIFILVGATLLSRPERSIAKNVSAKTVSETVEEFVEATMSAVFR